MKNICVSVLLKTLLRGEGTVFAILVNPQIPDNCGGAGIIGDSTKEITLFLYIG